MTPRVELVYDPDCPNVAAARTVLLQALARTRGIASWVEWDRQAPETPAHVRGYGSPTILVNGQDVGDAVPGDGAASCRVYTDGADGFRRVPSIDQVIAALAAAHLAVTHVPRAWPRVLAVVPGLGAALLPIGICPACWPAYAGLLGSVGLGILFEQTYLLPLTTACLTLALASLAYRARTRRGYRPLAAGMVAGALTLGGKFALDSTPLLYLGLAALIGASLWNAWPQSAAEARPCAACAPQGRATDTHAHTKEADGMTTKRAIEVFSAGCPACEETIALVNRVACPSCEITVLDMRDVAVAGRATQLGIRSVPAVVIDGTLADCCAGRGPDEATLRAAGLGVAHSRNG